MKKVLVGCGVLFLLGAVLVVGSMVWVGSVVKNVAGDLITATQTAVQMSLDRMEQEATPVTAVALSGRLPDVRGRPVRVAGSVMVVADKDGNAPPGVDGTTVMFLEPGVVVMGVSPDVLPGKRGNGTTVEVLGIAGTLNLGVLPGLNDEGRAALQKQLGGTELPVVVARKVTVTTAL
jgi:hypothetical protein